MAPQEPRPDAARRADGAEGDWRHRILPRSVLGLSALLLSAALGAAFSGAVLYAYYDYRLDTSDSRAEEYARTFEDRLEAALSIIEQEGEEAKAAVRAELEPLQKIAASGETLEQLLEKVAPSTFFVSTLAEDGSPSVGSAFVVFSDAEQSFLLTSFTTIRAATRQPGPPVRVRKGDDEMGADLVTWEPERDLALLSIPRGGVDRLPWSTADPVANVGDRVFAVSGLGGSGGAVSQGLVADVSGVGIQHDVPLGTHFQGGPLINSNGEVVGLSSRTYAPLGFATDGVFFGVPIRTACDRVLRCPDDAGAVGAGGD